MGVAQARRYIQRLRTEPHLRQEFEQVWQGKRRQHDAALADSSAPIVPRMLAASPPDMRADPEGYRQWWSRHQAQQDMHDLLFSKGEGRDHAQRYLDGSMVTDAGIASAIAAPEMREALDLLARLAAASTGEPVSRSDMEKVWQCYLHWIYRKASTAGAHGEVRRLRADAAMDAALRHSVDLAAHLEPATSARAGELQIYLETGFAAESDCEEFERQRLALEAVSRKAAEAGYSFTAVDYLKDCLFRQRQDDPGPARDEKYWREDDPNVWNHEPPAVFFNL